jgi:hypothetical protein
MTSSHVTDLRQAGIGFDRYRDLARPIQDGQAAERWPLVAATNQVLAALRWKREALAPQAKVRQLNNARVVTPTGANWLLSDAAPSPSASSTGRTGS